MVGAVKAGKDLAGDIIATSELFYNRQTQLRYLLALNKTIGTQVRRLVMETKERKRVNG